MLFFCPPSRAMAAAASRIPFVCSSSDAQCRELNSWMSQKIASLRGVGPGFRCVLLAQQVPPVSSPHVGSANSTSGQNQPAANQRPLDFRKSRMRLLLKKPTDSDLNAHVLDAARTTGSP